MPVLENARHERFAQALAKGKSQAEAYADAGYKPSEPNASRLTSNDKVQARLSELQERAATRTEITVASITERLLAIATNWLGNAPDFAVPYALAAKLAYPGRLRCFRPPEPASWMPPS